MQYVSLVTGLVIAFAAALSMGGWQSEAGSPSLGASPSAAIAPRAQVSQAGTTAMPVLGTPVGPPPSMLVFVTDTRDEAEEAERRFGPSYPGWDRAVLIIDSQIAAQDFVYAIEAVLEAERLGAVSALKIIDLRGP